MTPYHTHEANKTRTARNAFLNKILETQQASENADALDISNVVIDKVLAIRLHNIEENLTCVWAAEIFRAEYFSLMGRLPLQIWQIG